MSSASAALVSRDRGKPSPALAATLKASGTLAANIDPEKIQGIRSALMDSTVAGSLTAEQLRRVETGWPQSTLPGTVRAATLRAAEQGLVAGGIGGLSAEVYRLAAEAIPTGRFSSILDSVAYKRFREGISSGLVPRVVDAAQDLMSSVTISGRLRAEAPKMAGGWLAGTGVKDLYSPAETARLAARVGTFPIGSALLAEKYSLGGPMAHQGLAELAGQQAGILPVASYGLARRLVEQHLTLMPKWAVAEMIKMRVRPADLAGLGAPRAGLDPTATLHKLVLRHGVGGIKPLHFNAGPLASVKAIDYPMPFLSGYVAPARVRQCDIELPGPAVVRQRPPREDPEVAPVAAGFLARRRRETVIAFFEAAELTSELEQLEAIEERLRTGSKPALVHAAVSARRVLQGVADRFFPARSGMYVCRFECPHNVGSGEVANRISAFVDERLRYELDTHTHKQFQGTLEWVFRWGGRGTHEECSATEALQGFLWLLEVMTMVARAHEAQSQPRLEA
jgi:hypothetical protein